MEQKKKDKILCIIMGLLESKKNQDEDDDNDDSHGIWINGWYIPFINW